MITQNRLPDFIIVGAAKAGTTSLVSYLWQHPSVYFPEHKEPYFFSFEGVPHYADDPLFRKLIIADLGSYQKLFAPSREGQICGEASTSYLYTHRTTISRLQEEYGAHGRPLPKIIAILRNPIDRAFSHYVYLRQKGVENLQFRDAIRAEVVASRLSLRYWDYDYLNYGMYSEQIRHFRKVFPGMRIYLFEDLAQSPNQVVEEIFGYLGLDPVKVDTGFVANPSGVPTNAAAVHALIGETLIKSLARTLVPARMRGRVRRMRDAVLRRFLTKPAIDPELKRELIEHYRKDVIELQHLLGRDLSHWLEISSTHSIDRSVETPQDSLSRRDGSLSMSDEDVQAMVSAIPGCDHEDGR